MVNFMAAPSDFYVYILFDYRAIPRYVGKGCGYRWVSHGRLSIVKQSNRKSRMLRKTLRLLGEIPTIKIAEGLSEQQAYAIEIALIKTIGRLPAGPLANQTDGGDGVANPSPDTRAKMSRAAKARGISEALKAAADRVRKTRIRTAEEKAKTSATLTGRRQPSNVIEKIRAAKLGTKHSLETREKMSVAQQARRHREARAAAGVVARQP